MKKYFSCMMIMLFAINILIAEEAILTDENGNFIIQSPVSIKYDKDGSGETQVILKELLRQMAPTGSVRPYGGNTVPDGWLLCDGLSVSSTVFPMLYSVIGTKYGDGSDGTGDFNLPDLRGVFLRGHDARDEAESKDPDAASRTVLKTGGSEGVLVGSYQEDTFQNHQHPYLDYYKYDTSEGSAYSVSQSFGTSAFTTANKTTSKVDNAAYNISSETRPKNVAVNYIIKY